MAPVNPENPCGDRPFTSLERGDPAAGMLLPIAPDILSPEFVRSVAFLIEHDEHGALGVDLARRSQTLIHNVLEPWMPLMIKPPMLCVEGSASQTQPICVGIVRDGAALPEETDNITGAPLMEHITRRPVLVDLGAKPEGVRDHIDDAYILAGYAGWNPRQLEDEFERGDWCVAPVLPSGVLTPTTANIWGNCVRCRP